MEEGSPTWAERAEPVGWTGRWGGGSVSVQAPEEERDRGEEEGVSETDEGKRFTLADGSGEARSGTLVWQSPCVVQRITGQETGSPSGGAPIYSHQDPMGASS